MYNIKLKRENIICIKKVGTLQQIDCDYCGPLNVILQISVTSIFANFIKHYM